MKMARTGGLHGFRRGLIVGVAASLLVMASGASSVQGAANPCAVRTTTRPFIPWGDYNEYFPGPGGLFEVSSLPWMITGNAMTTFENEPWRINGATDMASLLIFPNSLAVSVPFCVQTKEDAIRLFVKRPGFPGAALQVRVTALNLGQVASNSVVIEGSSWGWKLSPRIAIPDLRDTNGDGQQIVFIEVFPINSQTSWQIDDLMVDPIRTK